jgi:hypothetical protein
MLTNIPEKSPPFYCTNCDTKCHDRKDFNRHILTSKHLVNITVNKKVSRISGETFSCEDCDYSTCKKQNFEKHLSTQKHLVNIKYKKYQKVSTETEDDNHFLCDICNKVYSSRVGLWKHKKNCMLCKTDDVNDDDDVDDDNDPDKTNHKLSSLISPELILLLVQQNKDMQNMLFEMAQKTGNNNNCINNSNNNSNNKTFNLQIFLNETCKNAMNLSEFVNRVVVTLDDFETTGKLGYVEGISRIFYNELQKLDICERPIHCSDVKRETLYVKECDKWEKEDDKREKITNAIRKIGMKNFNMLKEWQKKHPTWSDSESKDNDRYLKYVFNIMCGGSNEEIEGNYNTIVRNISKVTTVDKGAAALLAL